jgi:hypothetical protein
MTFRQQEVRITSMSVTVKSSQYVPVIVSPQTKITDTVQGQQSLIWPNHQSIYTHRSLEQYRRPCSTFQKFVTWLAATITPFGFETLPSFRPENYANGLGRRSVCYSLSPVSMNADNCVVLASDLFVARDLRNWIRIRLRLTMAHGSNFFKPLDGVRSEHHHVREIDLPENLISQIQHTIAQLSYAVHDDMEVGLRLLPNTAAQAEGSIRWSKPALARYIGTTPEKELLCLTNSLRHHHGLRFIPEKEVVVTRALGVSFLASLDGHWVHYRPVYRGPGQYSQLRRNVKTSLMLRGAPNVAQLLGISIDSNNGLLKGLLTALPANGPLFGLMALHRAVGRPIPWPIRQKWAKQTVRAVAVYHDLGLLMRLCTTTNHGLSLDNNYDVRILPSVSRGHPATYSANPGLTPPEYRTPAFEHGDGNIALEFDLFQLGSLLWHLYRDQDQQTPRSFCLIAGCHNARFNSCLYHGDPISLPKAGPDIPDYLERVITLCRNEDPGRRCSAHKLVELFPSDEEIARQITAYGAFEFAQHSATSGLTRLEFTRRLYSSTTCCDICGERCFETSFLCPTCRYGNFDVCRTCFNQGLHCPVGSHLLMERDDHEFRDDISFMKKLVYYSSVDVHGRRSMQVF